MNERAAPICIQCGHKTTLGAADHLNRMSDGRPCGACAARLLETLPSLLPGVFGPVREPEFVDGEPDYDMPA
jgi:hypothetical protein